VGFPVFEPDVPEIPAETKKASLEKGAMSLEQIGMRPHALENQAIAVKFINDQPIRFDVAFPPSLPITDKLVVAVNGVKRLSGDKGQGDEFEFFRILSTAQAPLYILFKLTCVDGNTHASESQFFKQVIGILADYQIAPVIRFPEGALCRFAGNCKVKGQALMQLNLLVKKGNCLCGVQANRSQYSFCVFLESRLHPGSDHCAFTHN
jgi:hypothetical protein